MEILRNALVAILTMVFIAGLIWLIGRQKPSSVSDGAGSIRPERFSATITVITGAALLIGNLTVFISKDGHWINAIGALIGVVMLVFMAPSLSSVHAVNWDKQGIEGPSSTFGLTLGLARTIIKWSEIVSTGKTVTGYWYVQSDTGKRIFWSYLYKGHSALERF